jgi:cell filamentation protein
VLRNNFGVDTQTVLSDLEFVATAGRMVGRHRMLAEGAIGVHDVDVRAIHQHLFADVYPWAGTGSPSCGGVTPSSRGNHRSEG